MTQYYNSQKCIPEFRFTCVCMCVVLLGHVGVLVWGVRSKSLDPQALHFRVKI